MLFPSPTFRASLPPRPRGFFIVAIVAVVAVQGTVCPARPARAQNAAPQTAPGSKPVYARLSDAAILQMSAVQFEARFGKDLTGERLDDLLNYYADCLARRNDRAALSVSPALARKLKTWRRRLAEWDYETFTPNDRFTQGIDRGHKDASDNIARETALKTVLPLLRIKKRPFVNIPWARAQLHGWIINQEMGIIPLPDELAGKNAGEKADVRAAYADWYKRLKTQARLLEAASAQMSAPAAEEYLLYAARWQEIAK